MAELRTLKHGRLYLLKDGSAFDDFAQASVSSGGLFEKSDGSWGVLMEESGDIMPYSGYTPASIQAATPSAVLSGVTNYSKPVTALIGGRLHIWWNRSTDSDLGYGYSDNDATSVTNVADLNIVGDQTWCNDAIWPLYFDYEADGTNAHRLWCVGQNSTTYTLGYVAVDTSGGLFNAEIGTAANYTAAAAGSLQLARPSEFVTMVRHNGVLNLYGRSGGDILEFILRRSTDGVVWSEAVPVFHAGISGTNDFASLWPFSVIVNRGMFHLLYGGQDGIARRAMLAVGESPDRLYKVPWMDVSTFGGADILTSYTSDLTFTMPDQSRHVMDRNGPGALIDAPFEPLSLSFTARFVGDLSETDGVWDWLTGGASPEAGEDSATANAGELGRLNIAYITENDAGTPSEYYLFPMVGIQSLQLEEGAEGDTINVTGQMHSMQRPLFGRI